MSRFNIGNTIDSDWSCFVLIVLKENHKKVLELLTPYQKDVINQLAEESKLLGKEIIYFGDFIIDERSCTFEYYFENINPNDYKDEKYYAPEEVFDYYYEEIKKISKKDEILYCEVIVEDF